MVLIPSYNIRKKIEKWQYFIYCTTRELQTYSFRHATDASKHPHATGPGQPAPVGGRRETLRRVPSFVVAQEMELVGQRTRDDEAAALALIVTVGASGEPPLRRPHPRCLRRRRGAGGGDEVVVHRPPRRPPLLDRAVDERDEPLHPHLQRSLNRRYTSDDRSRRRFCCPVVEDSKHLVELPDASSHCEE